MIYKIRNNSARNVTSIFYIFIVDMENYNKPASKNWIGRTSGQKLYLHEKVAFLDFENETIQSERKTIVLLGYACDAGVQRNQGRIGAENSPNVIRQQLGKMPNHLEDHQLLVDVGNVTCPDGDMEKAQAILSSKVLHLLTSGTFPILLGGGHDIAYAHYNGIKKFTGEKTIGIINFDAHFDLRSNSNGNNSGTPFYQIAKDCKAHKTDFKYMVLGIRKDANDAVLFETAKELDVKVIENNYCNLHQADYVGKELRQFISSVDYVYVTIDLDGFSSAYAMGVSAPSPMGFTPGFVLDCLQLIIKSKKMISLDLAEMNPKYDIDNQTAKLAASLVHFVIDKI